MTDHAVIRYIERIMGQNLDHIRDEIRAIAGPHRGLFTYRVCAEEFVVVVRDGKIVSVYKKGE